jgi:hypothetical protein
MLEVPNQSIEALRELPTQVTWTDEGHSGSIFGGGYSKACGEFFSINLQGQSYEELEEFELPGVYYNPPATFDGSIERDDNDVKYLSAGTLIVGEDFRGNKLAKRLSVTMAYIAAEQGCKKIEISFSHPAALHIFREIYGDERIHFTANDFGETVQLDMTAEQASQAIVQERLNVMKYGKQMPTSGGILTHSPKTDDEILAGAIDGVSAWIDVEGFDVSGIEPPIQTGVLPGTIVDDEP